MKHALHPNVMTALALALLLLICPTASASDANLPAETPPLASFLGNVEVGPTGGWINGVVVSGGFLAGGAGQFFRFAVRSTVGITDSSNFGWDVGSELGWRMMLHLAGPVSLVVGAGATSTYMRVVSSRYDVDPYQYLVAGGRASVGVAFGRDRRVRHTLYLTGEGGYSWHLNCCGDNPWGEDYSQSTGRGGIRYSVTF